MNDERTEKGGLWTWSVAGMALACAVTLGIASVRFSGCDDNRSSDFVLDPACIAVLDWAHLQELVFWENFGDDGGSWCGRWTDPQPGVVLGKEIGRFESFEEAILACDALNECLSIVGKLSTDGKLLFSLMPSDEVFPATNGEVVYLMQCNTSSLKRESTEIVKEVRIFPKLLQNESNSNDESTILVHIASYRDPMCRNTIIDALQRAAKPDLLRFAIAEQRAASDDFECVPLSKEKACAQDELLCKHWRQIRVHLFDASQARGPIFARHRADKLFDGEDFVLQIDAHMIFARDWDIKLLEQWDSLQDEFAILTAYPTAAIGSINDQTGLSLHNSTPVMCEASLTHEGIVRFEGAKEVFLHNELLPMEHLHFAAGLSFAAGHRIMNVPYDECCLDFIFVGEEFWMASRLFTHGFSFFSFKESVVFHFYPHERPSTTAPLFWENFETEEKRQKQKASFDKIKASLMTGEGLGDERDIHEYFTLLGLDGFGTENPTLNGKELCHRVLEQTLFDNDEDSG